MRSCGVQLWSHGILGGCSYPSGFSGRRGWEVGSRYEAALVFQVRDDKGLEQTDGGVGTETLCRFSILNLLNYVKLPWYCIFTFIKPPQHASRFICS